MKRIACLLAIGVTLVVPAAPAVADAGDTTPTRVAPSSLAPVALPDLGGIFGDENEADENEADEGGSEQGGQSRQSSGISLPVLLLLAGLGLAVMRLALIRPRRRS